MAENSIYKYTKEACIAVKSISFDIAGLNNAEKYVNDFIEKEAEGLLLKDITVDKSTITFRFDYGGRERTKVVAKQFSKKKYSSEDVDAQIEKFLAQESSWQKKCIIEQKKIWLVIFARNISTH